MDAQVTASHIHGIRISGTLFHLRGQIDGYIGPAPSIAIFYLDHHEKMRQC
jgi:hypothetical protein